MPTHIIDSEIYGAAWGSDEMRAFFDEAHRTRGRREGCAARAEA